MLCVDTLAIPFYLLRRNGKKQNRRGAGGDIPTPDGNTVDRRARWHWAEGRGEIGGLDGWHSGKACHEVGDWVERRHNRALDRHSRPVLEAH